MLFALVLSLCLSLWVGVSQAFLPNMFSAVDINDYTHTDITEIGIVTAVAQFFEEHPISTCTGCTPGGLSSVTNLTPRTLFDKYYGGRVSEMNFQAAIDKIVRENIKVDEDHYGEADWHFNGEQIRESNQKMQILRDSLLRVLNGSNPNLEAAREMIGHYLHLLQMFYSNTNWVEMKGGVVYDDLGISGKQIMGTASADFDTCRNCGPTVHTPCDDNLIVDNLLTSGYRSGQDIAKPTKDPTEYTEGKCSHGGSRDLTSSSQAALGGINKDSQNPTFSPHHQLHDTAAQAAIEHTAKFFMHPTYGIRAVAGDAVFQDILQIRGSGSLIIVVDTTVSMMQDIAALRNKTRELVTQVVGTSKAPYTYILVTFNNPGNLTTLQQTSDAQELLKWLDTIVVRGGYECPQFSLTGIQRATTVAAPGSHLYVFTDATPKDRWILNYLNSITTEKSLVIQFVVTGECNP